MELRASRAGAQLLGVEQLTFFYIASRADLLKDVSLTIQPGERVGIWGDNGSGKSTFLKLLLGYLQPKRGAILWNGRVVKANGCLGFAGYAGDPGHSDAELGLPLGMTVTQLRDCHTVLSGPSLLPSEDSALMELLGVSRLGTRMIEDLSAGERKRVMLLLAMRLKRRILILDEPTEGLDHQIVDPLVLFVDGYLRRHACSLLLVSHRQDEVAFLTDVLYTLKHGRLSRSVPARFGFRAGPEGAESEMTAGEVMWHFRQMMQKGITAPLTIELRPGKQP